MTRLARTLAVALAIAIGAIGAVGAARAADYPTRPVKWIVPYPPGGTTDVLARVVAQWLSEKLGQPFVVENRPGGGNNIGTEAALRSPPDGYTMLLVNPANGINATLYKNLSFDFIRDVAPVAGLVRTPNVMEVTNSLPVKTVAEFIAYCKANPGKINMASSGSGTSVHLSGELFKSMTGCDMVHVPYKGAGPALIDLMGGQVHVLFDNLPSSIGHIKGGKLRAAGRHLRAARSGAAGRADGRRNRQGLRGNGLVRHRHAQGHAARRHREDQRRRQPGAGGPEDSRTTGRDGRQAHRRNAGRFRQGHRVRDREVGEGGRFVRRESRVELSQALRGSTVSTRTMKACSSVM